MYLRSSKLSAMPELAKHFECIQITVNSVFISLSLVLSIAGSCSLGLRFPKEINAYIFKYDSHQPSKPITFPTKL